LDTRCTRIKCVVWGGESESIKKLEFSFRKLVLQRYFCVQSILGAAKSNAPSTKSFIFYANF
jgi:hypothetical protein